MRDREIAHHRGREAELPRVDRGGRHRERGGPADELQRIDVELAQRELEVGAEEAAVAALVDDGVLVGSKSSGIGSWPGFQISLASSQNLRNHLSVRRRALQTNTTGMPLPRAQAR